MVGAHVIKWKYPLLDIYSQRNEQDVSPPIQQKLKASDISMREITKKSDISNIPGLLPSPDVTPPIIELALD